MKRLHRTLLTASVLVALGGGGALYAWMKELRNAQGKKQEESEAKRLFHFGRDHVAKGRIFARGSTIAFARDEEWEWKIVAPIDTPADPTAIEAALDRMAAMSVEPVDGELHTYELDRPQAWMEVSLDSGETLKLIIGPKNQMTEQRFVTDGTTRRVYLADSAFGWSVDRALEAFREHRVLPVAPEKVIGVASTSPRGPEWKLEKTAQGWTVTDGKTPPIGADEGEVHLIVIGLTKRLRVEHYLSEDGKLDDWKRRIELTLANGRTLAVRLGDYSFTGATGAEIPVAWVEGTTSVMEVPDWVRKDFTKSSADLRDHAVARFDQKEARRIEYWTAEKMSAAVERTGADALWTNVGGGSAEQGLPTRTLLATARLKAEKIEKENPSEAELRDWQLDPPRRRIVVLAEANRALADIRIGKKLTDEDMLIMEATRRRVGHYGTRLEDLFPGKGRL